MIYIAPDKIRHMQGGAAAAVACALIAVLLEMAGAHSYTIALGICGLVAGGSIEGMQWAENRLGLARREVSVWDFAATAAPAWASAAAWQAWLIWGGAL